MRKKIYYWSPFLSPIATSKAVVNSAYSLKKFSDKFEPSILNFFGEFNKFKKDIEQKDIILIDYFKLNISQLLPYKGKIKSRISFIIIFLFSFIPLLKLLKRNKPDYIIIHLITSLPLILLLLFNFDTKFVLRISGFPRINFFRKILWKLTLRKIDLITCPTKNTLEYIKRLNLTDCSKVKLLYDPIINVKEINKKIDKKIDQKNFYLSVGRLTKQKNFMFLCKAFKELIKENNEIKLLIAGEGEEDFILKKFINKNKLEKNIILLGHIQNIYPYLKNSKGFILTSLWEDPGFVLIEASYARTSILSANSWPGPVELIKDEFNGIVFENNNMESFLKKFKHFASLENTHNLKLNNLKLSRKFTLFSHYKKFAQLLQL